MSRTLDIGALADIPSRGARLARATAGRIAVFRTADDRVFALDDRRPHKNGPLWEGIAHDASVTCPPRNWILDLSTGVARGPDEGQVRTYPVRVQYGRILPRL